jgi:hypothetical protein
LVDLLANDDIILETTDERGREIFTRRQAASRSIFGERPEKAIFSSPSGKWDMDPDFSNARALPHG